MDQTQKLRFGLVQHDCVVGCIEKLSGLVVNFLEVVTETSSFYVYVMTF